MICACDHDDNSQLYTVDEGCAIVINGVHHRGLETLCVHISWPHTRVSFHSLIRSTLRYLNEPISMISQTMSHIIMR